MSQLPISHPSFIHPNLMPINTSARSGIIERHTYKTDSGKLLGKSPIAIPIRTPPKPSTSTNNAKISCRYLTSNCILFRAKSKSDVENQEKSKDVRTEHCDSTTDIIEHVNHTSPTVSEILRSDHNYPKEINPINNSSVEAAQTIHIDSDSDCEIVDYKNSDDRLALAKTRFCLSLSDTNLHNIDNIPNVFKQVLAVDPIKSKVLAWFADTEKLASKDAAAETVVISDSEDEIRDTVKSEVLEEPLKIAERPTVSSLRKKKELIRRSQIPELQQEGSATLTSDKDSVISSSLQEFCSSRATEQTKSARSAKEKTPTREVAVSPIIVKDSTIPVQNRSAQSSKSLVPPGEKSPVKIKSPGKEKSFVPPSPDTAKTELYSYLKINTNPSAKKTEAVTQNRRSNRVKNLTLQIEKAKELNNVQSENDVRKKYMKYSKPLVDFKATAKYLPTTIMHLDSFMTDYFRSEKIDYLKESLVRASNAQSLKRKRSISQNKEAPTKKIKYVKNVPSRASKRQARKKLREIRKLRATTLNYTMTSMQKQRFRSRRKLRNTLSRITRSTIDDIKVLSQKMLKITRAQLKSKIDKIKKRKARQITITNGKNNGASTSTELIENEKPDSQPGRVTITTKEVDTTTVESTSTTTVLADKNSSPVVAMEKRAMFISKNESVSTTISQTIETSTFSGTTQTQKVSLTLENNEQITVFNKPTNSVELNHPILQSYLTSEPTSTKKTLPLALSMPNVRATNINLQPQIIININAELPKNPTPKALIPEPLENLSPECIGFEQNKDQNSQVCDVEDESNKSGDSDKNQESSNKSLTSAASSRATNFSPINTEEIENDAITDDQQSNSSAETQNEIRSETITKNNPNYIPLNKNIKSKSFHKSLVENVKRKSNFDISEKSSLFELSDSDSSLSSPKTKSAPGKKSQTHVIDISECNGAVFNTYYVHNMLIIVQTQLITFWKQTALGNILGVQTMWIPSGSLQRIVLDSGCVNRRSSEMTLNAENSTAYVEIWTKEHKCQYRECPIADVFATIYFHKGHGQPDKKVLQLENIKGYGNDVRFAVTKYSRAIIVSWCDRFSKPTKTLVRAYELAPDFQTVSSVKEMESVSHYISSLHNIHGCENLVLGADNDKISIWNLTHGYLVITLNLSEGDISPNLKMRTICLYAQCDSGFLFLVQQINVGMLRLVAVNGITHEWKQLHSYEVPACYEKLLGVIVESGVLMTCYTNGFLCWNMHTGHIIAEIDTSNDQIVLPCNKHVVVIKNYNVTVQHVLSYILTHDW